MNAYAILGIAAGVVVIVVLVALWWWRRDTRAGAVSKIQLDAEQRAREAERDMADVMAEDRSTADTARHLNDKTF
jgi:hypothetical protein